jgi:RNA polymerase sigma-70 factor (ECF subfamily)
MEPLHDQHRAQELGLVRRVQSGDQDAFRQIVERHQDRIFSAIYRILHNREDSEDIAQQVFTKVYFAIKSFDCRCSLLTWIYKIAVNECYSHLRKRRLELAHEADAPEFDDFVTESWFGATRQPAADTAVAARDLLNKLLARLADEDRLLLLLKEAEGHSIAELAQMTGSSEAAIKTKLFRARQKLIEGAARLAQRPLLPSVCPDRVSL